MSIITIFMISREMFDINWECKVTCSLLFTEGDWEAKFMDYSFKYYVSFFYYTDFGKGDMFNCNICKILMIPQIDHTYFMHNRITSPDISEFGINGVFHS